MARRNHTLDAKETQIRRKIAALPTDYLARIGLGSAAEIEAHIAAEMADEADELGLSRQKLTVEYRLPTSQHKTTRLLDIAIARADLPKVNRDWAVELVRAYYDLPDMAVDILAVR